MPRYQVNGKMTISVFTIVEAKTKEEAEDIANGRAVMLLCHQCAGGDSDDEWVTSGELDGDPQITEIDDA